MAPSSCAARRIAFATAALSASASLGAKNLGGFAAAAARRLEDSASGAAASEAHADARIGCKRIAYVVLVLAAGGVPEADSVPTAVEVRGASEALGVGGTFLSDGSPFESLSHGDVSLKWKRVESGDVEATIRLHNASAAAGLMYCPLPECGLEDLKFVAEYAPERAERRLATPERREDVVASADLELQALRHLYGKYDDELLFLKFFADDKRRWLDEFESSGRAAKIADPTLTPDNTLHVATMQYYTEKAQELQEDLRHYALELGNLRDEGRKIYAQIHPEHVTPSETYGFPPDPPEDATREFPWFFLGYEDWLYRFAPESKDPLEVKDIPGWLQPEPADEYWDIFRSIVVNARLEVTRKRQMVAAARAMLAEAGRLLERARADSARSRSAESLVESDAAAARVVWRVKSVSTMC